MTVGELRAKLRGIPNHASVSVSVHHPTWIELIDFKFEFHEEDNSLEFNISSDQEGEK